MELTDQLDLAAMTDGNPVVPGTIFIPGTIELVDQTQRSCQGDDAYAIRWVTAPDARNAPAWAPSEPTNDLLESFWKLFNGQPREILLFAQNHGVLGLDREARMPDAPNMVAGLEPLERWRELASQVRSILRLAALLYQGTYINPEHIVGEAPPSCGRGHLKQEMHVPRFSSKGLCYVCPICLDVQPNESFGPISQSVSSAFLPVPPGRTARDEELFQEDLRCHQVAQMSRRGKSYASAQEQFQETVLDPRKHQIARATEAAKDAPPGCFWRGQSFPEEKRKRERIAQTCLDQTIEDWLFRFPSTLAMVRQVGEMNVTLEYRFGLLSAIALQLMQAVARKSVHLCSECKNPFVRHGRSKIERKPRADRNAFCNRCRAAGAISRRADDHRRENRTRARRLSEHGASYAEIAEKLGIREADTVRGWAKKGKWDVKKEQTR